MQTPIDFGKDFLNTLFDKRDADECLKMLAGDLVCITPGEVHHFLSESEVHASLRRQVKESGESRFVDIASIKSSPSAEGFMAVAYEFNLVSGEEDRPSPLRCSMVICTRGERMEITALHFSKVSEGDGAEQLRDFAMNLPCGVMVLACLSGQAGEALFYNGYFVQKLRYGEKEFARRVKRDPFFMAEGEDRKALLDQIARVRKDGGNLSANLRMVRKDGKVLYFRIVGAPACRTDGGIVFYCIFQETTGYRETQEKLQKRLDDMSRILLQVPEGICVIEYPPAEAGEEGGNRGAADSSGKTAGLSGKNGKNPAAAAVSYSGGKGRILSGKNGKNPAAAAVSYSEGKGRILSGKNGKNPAAAAVSYSGGKGRILSEKEGKSRMSAAGDGSDEDVKIYRGHSHDRREGLPGSGEGHLSQELADGKRGQQASLSGHPRLFYLSSQLPGMFGVSNSVFTKRILEDPFFGLELTSITRKKLLESPVFDREIVLAGKPVSCGIFRLKNGENPRRIELYANRTKGEGGKSLLFLFYYDCEARQQEAEARVERAMKLGRTGQDRIREDLRKARETAAAKQGELEASLRAAGEKHSIEISRFEDRLLEEKNRAVLLSRQLEESRAEARRREKEIEEAKEAVRTRGLLERQLQEALERARRLDDQLRNERTRRKLLEEQIERMKSEASAPPAGSLPVRPSMPPELSASARRDDWMAGAGKGTLTVYSRMTGPALYRSEAAGGRLPGASGTAAMGASSSSGIAARSISGSTETAARGVPGVSETAARGISASSAAERGFSGRAALTEPAARGLSGRTAPAEPAARGLSGRTAPAEPAEKAGSEGHAASSAASGMGQAAHAEKAEYEQNRELSPGPVLGHAESEGHAEPSVFSGMGQAVPAGKTDSDQEGKEHLQEEEFSPEECLRKEMVRVDESCDGRNILLRLYQDSRLPSGVRGFRGLFCRALRELVENSVARTGDGGVVNVHYRADCPSGGFANLYFRIDDRGVRIPEDGMQELLDNELASAREAAALMGGSLDVRSSRSVTHFLLSVVLRCT